MFRKPRKIKASTIVETIVAMVLILFIAGLISVLVNNSARQNKTRTLLALSRIKAIHTETMNINSFEDDFFEYDDMYVEKLVETYKKQNDIYFIVYEAYDLQKNEIVKLEKLVLKP